MQKIISLLVITLGLVCNLFAQLKTAKPKAEIELSSQPVTNVTNNIKMTTNGFKIESAYLVFEDETPVPNDNKVDLNQKVNLRIIVDSGWSLVNGKVYPGASEKIILNTGASVLKSDDLFAAYTEAGVSPEDARYITLKAIITKMDDKKKHAIVTFKVWDKKGTSTITGNYKLFIK
jgi:hypothetical protein